MGPGWAAPPGPVERWIAGIVGQRKATDGMGVQASEDEQGPSATGRAHRAAEGFQAVGELDIGHADGPEQQQVEQLAAVSDGDDRRHDAAR